MFDTVTSIATPLIALVKRIATYITTTSVRLILISQPFPLTTSSSQMRCVEIGSLAFTLTTILFATSSKFGEIVSFASFYVGRRFPYNTQQPSSSMIALSVTFAFRIVPMVISMSTMARSTMFLHTKRR